MGTHSSIGQDASPLRSWAKRAARKLSKKRPRATSYIFCYAGMSGVSLATALALEYNKFDKQIGMLYVRKEGEKSHGKLVEYHGDVRQKVMLVFVDDFSCSGDTRHRVIRLARKYVIGSITDNDVPIKFFQVFQNDVVNENSIKEVR